MYKSYKFRLYPTEEQKILLNKSFGCKRLVYNILLDKKIDAYKNENQSLSAFDLNKLIPSLYENYSFLKEVDSCLFRNAATDIDNAFKKFYKGSGYPKFKSKFSRQSYKTNCVYSSYKGKDYQSIKLDLINKTITLPKLKEVNIKGYRNLEVINGKIKSAVISKETTGKYYVSVLVDTIDIIYNVTPATVVGIDLGVKDLVITSNGEKFDNVRALAKHEKRLKRLQRELSRREKKSNNYMKTKMRIARLHVKIANTRKYVINEITKKLVTENDIIVSENLDVKSMTTKENKYNKSILDAAFSIITKQLEYKAKLLRKVYIKVNTYFPSSQLCSRCGEKNTEVKNLNIRKYECKSCHTIHDRDINASINIMNEGLDIYFRKLYS